jgi:hypothetical protein
VAIKVRRFYDSTITVDDPETGESRELPIRVTRFDMETFSKFEKNWRRIGDQPSNRMIQVRQQNGDEQEKDEKGEYVVSLRTVMERRLTEMTAEEREAYDKQDAIDEEFSKKFLIDSVCAYVRVPEGALIDEDDNGNEVAVTTGEDLIRLYAGRGDVLRQLLTAVWTENTMSVAEKKVRRSLFALSRSLNEQVKVAAGLKLVPTAGAAENAASVEIVGAMESEPVIPSGSEEAQIAH